MYQATYIIVIFSLFRRIGETFFFTCEILIFFEANFVWYDTGTVLVLVPDNSSVIEFHVFSQSYDRTGTGTRYRYQYYTKCVYLL